MGGVAIQIPATSWVIHGHVRYSAFIVFRHPCIGYSAAYKAYVGVGRIQTIGNL